MLSTLIKHPIPSLTLGAMATAAAAESVPFGPDQVKDLALFLLLVYGINVLGRRMERLCRQVDRLSLLIAGHDAILDEEPKA